jgi:hypothetical protein
MRAPGAGQSESASEGQRENHLGAAAIHRLILFVGHTDSIRHPAVICFEIKPAAA